MDFVEEFKSNFYKKGTTNIHVGKVAIVIVLFLGVFVFAVYKKNDLGEKALERKKYLRYTIGITRERQQNFKASKPTIKYSFTFLGKNYLGSEHIGKSDEENVETNGGRYYVEFALNNPENSQLLLKFPVPGNISLAPDSGWNYIPGY